MSDGFLTSATIGALTVAPSDSNVIYAGTGETTIRVDVSFGDGVYRSTDAGRSWQHLGLADTKQIGEIRVHPDNPDLVYVAALGDAFGPSEARGVYRSSNGGRSWDAVLQIDADSGAIDLSMDPTNPRILLPPSGRRGASSGICRVVGRGAASFGLWMAVTAGRI